MEIHQEMPTTSRSDWEEDEDPALKLEGEALPEQGRGDWVLVREKGKICPVVSANE